MRTILLIVLVCVSFGCTAIAGDLQFDAKIPSGKELDPIEIQHAMGIQQIPNRDAVEFFRDRYRIEKYDIPGLRMTAADVELFMVPRAGGPPDMAGLGPFILLKHKGDFFGMTARNYALVFQPITRQNLIAYLGTYQWLFGNPFSVVIENDYDQKEFRDDTKPPKTTTILETREGFSVELVLYTIVGTERFWQEDYQVAKDGTVKKMGEKILKELGGGKIF